MMITCVGYLLVGESFGGMDNKYIKPFQTDLLINMYLNEERTSAKSTPVYQCRGYVMNREKSEAKFIYIRDCHAFKMDLWCAGTEITK
jgi:hypothetical protein